MNTPIPEDKLARIREALFLGHKIEAIKRYREGTDTGLVEAKTAVEKLEAELRAASPEKFASPASGKGCLGVVLMACAVAGLMIPTCLHLVQDWKGRKVPKDGPTKTESRTDAHQEYDPFSDYREMNGKANPQATAKIKVTFISCGSQTEELDFDWLVPFQPTTGKSSRTDADEPSNE